MPVSGRNIGSVLLNDPILLDNIADYLSQELKDKFSLAISSNDFELFITKKRNNAFIFYPFNLISDSIQRIIFYKAAIYSNPGTTLLFEEPEAHSYPDYTIDIARDIAAAKDNQFFIVTHSPYLISELMSSLKADELAVHVVYNRDGSTHVHTLPEEDINHALASGADIVHNIRDYEPKETLTK